MTKIETEEHFLRFMLKVVLDVLTPEQLKEVEDRLTKLNEEIDEISNKKKE